MGNRRNRKSEMRRKRATWHYKRTRNVFVVFFFYGKRKSSPVSNAAHSSSNIRLKCSIHLAIGIWSWMILLRTVSVE